MLKTEQNDYANNFFVSRKADHENTADYEECLAKVDKCIYDDLSPKNDSSNHDYTIMTPTLNAKANPSDNPVHRKEQSLLKQLIILLFCILIAVLVTAVVTFYATKHHLSELTDKRKYMI